MTPERWQQVEEIFQSALDLNPEARAAYLTEACAADLTLKGSRRSITFAAR